MQFPVAMGRHARQQSGMTLVEVMVSLALGLLIVMATVALFGVASSTATTTSEDQGLQDSGRFATRAFGEAARWAGFFNFDINKAPITGVTPNIFPCVGTTPCYQIEGRTNTTMAGGSLDVTYMGAARASSDTRGDVVAFRYQPGGSSDSSILNCLGNAVTTTLSTFSNPPQPSNDLVLSSFYVDTSTVDTEPNLYCATANTMGVPGSSRQPLVRGVETLRVLYGYDSDNDSIPNQWLTAAEVIAVSPSAWQSVVAVRIGMVIRGAPGSAQQSVATTLYPLGQDFYAGTTFAAPADGRLRRVVAATFQLRNAPNWGS